MKIQSCVFLQYMVHTGQRRDTAKSFSRRALFQNRLYRTRPLEQSYSYIFVLHCTPKSSSWWKLSPFLCICYTPPPCSCSSIIKPTHTKYSEFSGRKSIDVLRVWSCPCPTPWSAESTGSNLTCSLLHTPYFHCLVTVYLHPQVHFLRVHCMPSEFSGSV